MKHNISFHPVIPLFLHVLFILYFQFLCFKNFQNRMENLL